MTDPVSVTLSPGDINRNIPGTNLAVMQGTPTLDDSGVAPPQRCAQNVAILSDLLSQGKGSLGCFAAVNLNGICSTGRQHG
jgi:hypothetical protein